MTISWPVASIIIVVLAIVLMAIGALVLASFSARTQMRRDQTRGRFAEEYRELALAYQALAQELRDAEIAIKADLAATREKVEAVERMMLEVQ